MDRQPVPGRFGVGLSYGLPAGVLVGALLAVMMDEPDIELITSFAILVALVVAFFVMTRDNEPLVSLLGRSPTHRPKTQPTKEALRSEYQRLLRALAAAPQRGGSKVERPDAGGRTTLTRIAARLDVGEGSRC